MLQKQKVNKYLSKSWRTGKIEFERSAKNCPQSMHAGALPWSWKEKQKMFSSFRIDAFLRKGKKLGSENV